MSTETPAKTPSRYRVAFSKLEAMRFTGNLDLHRTWERLLRRAGLPLAYSEGFRPHPRISLASALALGCTGGGELIDVWLESDLDPADILSRLSGAVPPGIAVHHARPTDLHGPALPTLVTASEYVIELGPAVAAAEVAARIEEVMAATSLPRERRGKPYDLRLLIEDLALDGEKPRGARLRMRLAAREGATGRPEEVLQVLGLDPARLRIHRERIVLREPQKAEANSR